MLSKQQTDMVMGYVRIARPDHWVKHVFIVPGIILAFLLLKKADTAFPLTVVVGFLSACCIASANYVINEWLDAKFDQYHPTKKTRPSVAGFIKPGFVYLEYVLLIVLGLGLAWFVNFSFFITSIILLVMGVVYNVEPLRLKDKVFLDVLTESVNNPLRLMLGWAMVSSSTIPPLSLFILYWFGGAFLMTAKRFAEYRSIKKQHKLEDLKRYRKSFETYTENSLLIAMFLYGLMAMFFIAAFLIKYRNEYLLAFPFFAVLFAYYLSMALKDTSIAETPERLHQYKKLMLVVGLLVAALTILTFINIPITKKIVGVDEQNINYRFWE